MPTEVQLIINLLFILSDVLHNFLIVRYISVFTSLVCIYLS